MTRTAANLPFCYADGADTVCEEVGFETIRLPGLTPTHFARAYAWAWRSLGFFDPATVSEAGDGAISEDQAVTAKQMLAAFLVRDFSEPRRGHVVTEPAYYRALASPAYAFARRFYLADDVDHIGRLMAPMLGIDVAKATRLGKGELERIVR